jgi:hypothetical protein
VKKATAQATDIVLRLMTKGDVGECDGSWGVAEREGFEPPVHLRVLRISSAVRSTTLPPLQAIGIKRFLAKRAAGGGLVCYPIATQSLLPRYLWRL